MTQESSHIKNIFIRSQTQTTQNNTTRLIHNHIIVNESCLFLVSFQRRCRLDSWARVTETKGPPHYREPKDSALSIEDGIAQTRGYPF